MRNILTIAERELKAYFSSPIAYVVLTIFIFLSGLFFQILVVAVNENASMNAMRAAQTGQPPDPVDMPGVIAQNYFGTMSFILLMMLPMTTMALFSEEKKRGTIELLLTAPITDLQIVLGKFLAAGSFMAILVLTTSFEMAMLYVYSDPASGPILTAYLGLLLYGLAIVAICMFMSTLTENQIIAAVLGFGVVLLVWIIGTLASWATGTARALLTYLSLMEHLDDFTRGVIGTSHIIFYVSITLVGLFLTYRSLDSLRWRS